MRVRNKERQREGRNDPVRKERVKRNWERYKQRYITKYYR